VRALIRDESGAALVYVTVLLSLLIGVGTLAVDVGRYTTLHSQLQNAADAAALAGARELDGLPGSISRSRAAAMQAIANRQDFASSGAAAIAIDDDNCASLTDQSSGACIRFLAELPANDSLPVTAGFETNQDDEAHYIEVRVGRHTINAIFASALGGTSEATATARAVAGNDPLICAVPPMFFCNPAEPAGNTNPELPVNMAVLKGKQIQLFLQGGGGQYTPGNFGLLCPLDTEGEANCGGASIADSLASAFGTCMRRSGLTSKTGVTLQMVRTGVNVRFDSYSSQASNKDGSWRSLPGFHPAVNVTQGGQPQSGGGGNRCEWDSLDQTRAKGMPRDNCFATDSCGGRVGTGEWNWQDYFRINHSATPADLADASWRPTGWPSAAPWPPTRFAVYRWEIEKNTTVQPGRTITNADGSTTTTLENGKPQCYPPANQPGNQYTYYPPGGGAPVNDLRLLTDRRIMPLAVANCNALGTPSGKFTFDPSDLVFAFLTEPMQNPSDSSLWVEILGALDISAEQELLRDVVQLYRR